MLRIVTNHHPGLLLGARAIKPYPFVRTQSPRWPLLGPETKKEKLQYCSEWPLAKSGPTSPKIGSTRRILKPGVSQTRGIRTFAMP